MFTVGVATRFYDLVPFNGPPLWEDLIKMYSGMYDLQTIPHTNNMRMRYPPASNAASAINNLSLIVTAHLRHEYPLFTFELIPGVNTFSINLTNMRCDEKMIPEHDENLWQGD